jgi:hypothetical protein
MKFYSSANMGAKFINVFKHSVAAMADEAMGELAVYISQELKTRIRKQSFAHRPLSRRYVEYKKKAKLDPRILIASGNYVNAISARKRKLRGDLVWTVGVPDTIHGPSGMSYTQLARILEFGSAKRGIPPRPHWRPVWAIALRTMAPKILGNAMSALVGESIKRSGGRTKHPDLNIKKKR